jgi:predicted transcriptional regulator
METAIGGRRAAAVYTLIETCKLNEVDPQAWLADVLARLPDHPARRIDELEKSASDHVRRRGPRKLRPIRSTSAIKRGPAGRLARTAPVPSNAQDVLFKTLADPTRRAIFERLCREGEQTVGALTAGAGVSQPAVSKHLGVLKQAGLVLDRQEGRQTHYSAQIGALAPLID